jgi:hypothetical protein
LTAAVAAAATAPAVVVQVNGAPTVKRGDSALVLVAGTPLQLADVIETRAAEKVRLAFTDDSILTVGPKSRVAIDEYARDMHSRTTRLRALAGSFKMAVTKLLAGARGDVEIRTPTAVIGVRGTIVWGDVGLDAVCALDGEVEVRSLAAGAAAPVARGQCVQAMAKGAPVALVPSAAELSAYLEAVTLE